MANKLIINPEALARIRTAVAALEDPVEPMPERVRRFLQHCPLPFIDLIVKTRLWAGGEIKAAAESWA